VEKGAKTWKKQKQNIYLLFVTLVLFFQSNKIRSR